MATTLLESSLDSAESTSPSGRDTTDWVARLTMATVALGILWRVIRYLMQFPIWGDEAYLSLSFLDRDFWQMTRTLEYNQVAPILFLWIEWLALRTMGPSELSLHLFPLLAGVGGLLLFWRFCRLTLPPVAGSLAVAVLAASYYPARHATEIKPYSFDLLMAMSLLLPAACWLRLPKGQTPVGYLVLLTLITPFAVAGSYPAVFVAGGVSLALLPRVWSSRSWKVWFWFLAFNLAMAGTFVAHIKLVGGEQLDAKADVDLHKYWENWFPPVSQPWRIPLWLLKAHTGVMMAYPVGASNGGSTLTFLLCVAGVAALVKARNSPLIVLCLAPVALSLLAAFVHRYPYGGSARLAQHLAPAICLLMGYGIVYVLARLRGPKGLAPARTEVCILVGLAAIALGGLVWNVYRPFKMPGDQQIRQLLQDVAAKAQSGDTIVVFEHPDNLRANMIWYLRMTDLPIVYHGQADWPALAAQGKGVWGFSVHGVDRPKRSSADLLGEQQSFWSLVEERQQTFEKDSIDVPRQDCEVYRWVSRRAAGIGSE